MKTKTIIITIFLLSSLTVFSQSNLFGSFGGGLSAPIGDFASGYNVGYNVSGNVGLKVHRIAGVRFDIQYNSFGSSSDIVDGRFSLITLTADAVLIDFGKLKGNSSIAPYAIGGMGMYFTSSPDINLGTLGTIKGESKSYFGIGLGGGVAFKMSPGLSLFGELKYSFTLGGETFNYVPIKVGVMFTP